MKCNRAENIVIFAIIFKISQKVLYKLLVNNVKIIF